MSQFNTDLSRRVAPGLDVYAEDWASEGDRIWFAQNPGRTTRIRRRMPKELANSYGSHVLAVQIRPGVRFRQALPQETALALDALPERIVEDFAWQALPTEVARGFRNGQA